MAREDFLRYLHDAAYALRGPTPQSETPSAELDEFARAILQRDRWLTPRAVEGFDPEEFIELSAAERQELRREVEEFRTVASEVTAESPPTKAQVEEALPHFRRLLELVRQALVAEWREALEQLVAQTADWARAQDWAVKEDSKRLTETLLGTYDAPRLLVHTPENNRFLLDPVAREVVGGSGRVELCLMPSYDSVVLVRTDKGWSLLPERPAERRRPWSRKTFLNAAARLLEAA